MPLDWFLALLPILIILTLMVLFRWGAARAGPLGWFTAMAVATLRFSVDLRILAFSQVKALLLTVDVLLIIWAAFLLFRVAEEAGAIKEISSALPGLTANRGMQALIIGWAFASFLQGVGGFGVPTAVTAPLLVGLGFSPLQAVVIPSIGHAWSVTFGSLASSFQALIGSTGIAGEMLAPAASIILAIAGLACGIMVVHAASGRKSVLALLLPILIMAAAMGITQFLLATNGLWNIAGFGSGLVGLILGFVLARLIPSLRSRGIDKGSGLALALSGYIALIVTTLLIQLVPQVRDALGLFQIRVSFPELATTQGYVTPAGLGRVIPVFRHGGAILFYAALVAFLIYSRAGKYSSGAAGRILSGTMQRVMTSSLGIVAMVSMAVIMSHAGMTEVLATGLATGAGDLFPVASPWIGALGAFMTGSNTNSNVVFAALQLRTAKLLGLSIPLILAAQTAGAAIGSVIAPTKIVVGASTAGMGGKEGLILRHLLGYTALLIALVSLVVVIMLR
jgi:lactate permease